MRDRTKSFGLLNIAGGIQIEEPADGRQAKWMRDLAGLSKQLDWQRADGLAQAGRGGLEGGKTAAVPGVQRGFQRGQQGALKHRRKSLGKR